MYAQLNEKLAKSRQDMLQQRKMAAMLEALYKERDTLEARAEEAKAILEKENRDYEKITQKSLVSIFYSIAGTLEERTEKERREAVEAQLRYSQCQWDLEDVQRQIAHLEGEQVKYQGAAAEFERLYQEKFQLLLAESILELEKQIEESQSRLREVAEAIAVGQEVLRSLEDVLSNLSDAKDWGTWDMFGGGMMTSYVKHSHIDGANENIQRTQSLLRCFRIELADVNTTIVNDFSLHISDFDRFADFFFDNFIVDWFIQNKIKETQERVYTVQSQVAEVMNRLGELRSREDEVCKSLHEEKTKRIVEA